MLKYFAIVEDLRRFSVDLAANIVNMIHPYLGILLTTGVGALGKEVGKDVWEGVKAVWLKLGPAVAENPALRLAAQEVVERRTTQIHWPPFVVPCGSI
jgi:hypothetical protein